jgi:hypothetical protein
MKNRPVSSIQFLQSKRFILLPTSPESAAGWGASISLGRKAAEWAADAGTCGIEAVVVIWFAIYYDGLVIVDCRHDQL